MSAVRMLAAGIMGFAAWATAEPVTIRVTADGKPPPAWAIAELEMLDGYTRCYHTLLDKLVDGKVDIPPVPQLTVDGGCDDDWAEGVAMWDFYALNRHDERVQKAYVRFWNVIFRERRMPGRNPFWCTGGFDAEHYSELFQLLWGALELEPENRKLIADNRRCIDFIMKEVWDPKTRLMRNSYHLRGKLDKKPGEVALNTIWLTAAFHAWLTTGREKYRTWALDYGTSWNELAQDNGGVFPYYVPPGTRVLNDRWHETPWRGFGYDRYGIVTPMRALHSLPTVLMLMDDGNRKHVQGMLSMLGVLSRKGRGGLPAAIYNGSDWIRGREGNWGLCRLFENTYGLTFDPKLREMYLQYMKAAAGDGQARTEHAFMRYPAFYYFDRGGLDEVTQHFRNRARRIAGKTEQYRNGKAPQNGDDVREQYTPYVSGMEYIVGSWWGRYDNGRCGGPVPGSVRYFTGDGEPGLPRDVAALVRRVEADKVVLWLHNRATEDTAVVVTAGWYGQHRWMKARWGGEDLGIGSRRLKIVLGPGATADVVLEIKRFVNEPTLTPQGAG